MIISALLLDNARQIEYNDHARQIEHMFFGGNFMKKLVCLLLVAILCFSFTGCTREEMDSDELTAKRIIEQANDGISDIEYVNFLEEANNGYNDYYYYDVITEDDEKYIVEIRDSGTKKEYNLKKEYNSNSDRKQFLSDLIAYRCSEYGSLSDSFLK